MMPAGRDSNGCFTPALISFIPGLDYFPFHDHATAVFAFGFAFIRLSNVWNHNLDILRQAFSAHFLHPPHKHNVVEVVKGLHTSKETVRNLNAFITQIGKTPIEVSEDRERQHAALRNYRWESHCGGLMTLPIAA